MRKAKKLKSKQSKLEKMFEDWELKELHRLYFTTPWYRMVESEMDKAFNKIAQELAADLYGKKD